MERRRPAPALSLPLLLLLLLLAGLTAPHEAAAAAAAPSDQTRPQLGDTDWRADILAEVELMDQLLRNMTTDLLTAEGGDDTAPDLDTRLDQGPFALTLDLLPHGRVLSKRSGQPRPPLSRRLVLERLEALSTADTACDKDVVNKALADSAAVLDSVTAGEFNPDVLTELKGQNGVLSGFLGDNCSLSSMNSEVASGLLDNVAAVQTHAAAAKAAATPAEIGLRVSSAYMVVLITLCCLLALVTLVGLAVLAFRYTTTTTTTTSGGGGGMDAQALPKRVAGQPNPAYQPTDPPGSLHQARNERLQRVSGHAESESPHRPPAASKSTWGRIWGGVVRDYQRSRDSVAETRNDGARGYPTDEPRRERRASPPPPRRHSPHPPRRTSPPPRCTSPPPRRYSPPPRRNSPSPQPEGGDNWAYGPTGRNKSIDSPFASAW